MGRDVYVVKREDIITFSFTVFEDKNEPCALPVMCALERVVP